MGLNGDDPSDGARSSGHAVDPFGDVFPCMQWLRPIRNIGRSSIREIWDYSSALYEVRTLSQAVKTTVDRLGEAGKGTMHCLGLSEELTGDPLVTDPVSHRYGELYRAVNKES